MGFVVLHMEKAHGSDSGTTAHIERFIIPKNADPTCTHLNRSLIEYPDGVKDPTDGTRLVLAIDRKPIVVVQEAIRQTAAEHTPTYTAAKGKQGMKI